MKNQPSTAGARWEPCRRLKRGWRTGFGACVGRQRLGEAGWETSFWPSLGGAKVQSHLFLRVYYSVRLEEVVVVVVVVIVVVVAVVVAVVVVVVVVVVAVVVVVVVVVVVLVVGVVVVAAGLEDSRYII